MKNTPEGGVPKLLLDKGNPIAVSFHIASYKITHLICVDTLDNLNKACSTKLSSVVPKSLVIPQERQMKGNQGMMQSWLPGGRNNLSLPTNSNDPQFSIKRENIQPTNVSVAATPDLSLLHS